MNVWEIKDLADFNRLAFEIGEGLLKAPQVAVGSWQSRDVRDDPNMVSFELRHAHIEMPIPDTSPVAYAELVGANLPWAEDHFQERVGGQPLNPPPSEAYWPYAQAGNAAHKEGQIFSHTYPERFWPRWAAIPPFALYRYGIRYRYGDLADVVQQLIKDEHTRQAYLPVWFPEDTGATEGQRVPCTLGYHFLCRDGKLDIEYHIRSCDYMRHWRDDVYMAGRLAQWVSSRIGAKPGSLVMNIGSLHIFQGDRIPLARTLSDQWSSLQTARYVRIVNAL